MLASIELNKRKRN